MTRKVSHSLSPIEKEIGLTNCHTRFTVFLYHGFFLWCVGTKTNFFYDGKKIAKLKEESIIVGETVKTAESTGIKKLRLRTAESVAI